MDDYSKKKKNTLTESSYFSLNLIKRRGLDKDRNREREKNQYVYHIFLIYISWNSIIFWAQIESGQSHNLQTHAVSP